MKYSRGLNAIIVFTLITITVVVSDLKNNAYVSPKITLHQRIPKIFGFRCISNDINYSTYILDTSSSSGRRFINWSSRDAHHGYSAKESCEFSSYQLQKNLDNGALIFMVNGKNNKADVICASSELTTMKNPYIECSNEKTLIYISDINDPQTFAKRVLGRFFDPNQAEILNDPIYAEDGDARWVNFEKLVERMFKS